MSAIEVYKKIPIYRDDTSNDIYLYRRKHGKGRVNFPNLKECKKYIDNHCEDIECAKNVVLKAGCHGKPKKEIRESI